MTTAIEKASAKLIHARRASLKLDALAPDEQPRTLDEGYDIQRRCTASWPDEVVGWKVGATSLEIQNLFGISEPVYGPVFAQTVFPSPATVPADQFSHRLVEAEFTFRLGRRLAPRGWAYSRAEVLESIDALFPSLELVNPRFASLTIHNIPQLVADFCANGGAVIGPECRTWQSLDLRGAPVRLLIDDQERQRGTGSLVLGDPLNVLDWFVNKLTGEGRSIEAGQFVMTGTMTGLHTPPTGRPATARFGLLGDVTVTFE